MGLAKVGWEREASGRFWGFGAGPQNKNLGAERTIPAARLRAKLYGLLSSVREEVERVVREVLAPLIGADGGEVWLVSAEDTAVSLHLAGRYAGCPGNTLTKRRIIEPAIGRVAPRAQVTVTSGVLVPPGAERIA